jgi:hypothetical protein
MTPGCSGKVKTRGVCTKCYSTLRVLIQKGKINWNSAVTAGLCLGSGEGSNLSPIQAAIAAAEDKGKLKVGQSMPTPQFDEDQEPPAEPPAPAVPIAPPGYYYDADWQLQPIPIVNIPKPDPSPAGYAAYNPNAPAAADMPHAPTPRDVPRPEPIDPVDGIEDEVYADDESPEQKARRRAIERRHRKRQEEQYIEENGILPPRGGNVVVVPAPKVNVEKNGEIETGYGAGPPEGLKIQPGIYIQRHDAPAQLTIDGEPLLPGWSIAPDGRNLVNPQGQIVDTTPRQPGQQVQPPQAMVLPTPNSAPSAQLLTWGKASPYDVLKTPQGQNPWADQQNVTNAPSQPVALVLPPNAQGAPRLRPSSPPWENK